MRPEETQSDTDTPVIVEFKQYGGENSFLIGITRSLSPEGISFDSHNYDLPQGEKLECTLKHPCNSLSVPATGMISSKKELWYKCVTELKFIDLTEQDKGRIRELLSSIPCRSESDAARYPGPSSVQHETEVRVATAAAEFQGNVSEKNTRLRQKKNRNVIQAVAACALIILAGIYFFMSGTPGTGRNSGAGPLLNDAVNSQTNNLSDEIRTALVQDTSPENKQLDMEQPAAMQPEQLMDAGRPATDITVQPSAPGTIRTSDESGHISKTDFGDHPLVSAGIKTHLPSSGGDDPETPQDSTTNHSAENDPQASPGEQAVVYNESFDNNANKWDIFHTGMAAALIKNGEYNIRNKRTEGAHIILQHSDFPFGLNFSIEVLVRTVKSSGRHSYGLVFGAKDARNYYAFQVSASDLYSVTQYHEGSLRELAGGKIKNSPLMQNQANSLKIVRQGEGISFYINDVYADKVPDLSFNGNKMGFIVDGEAEIAVERTRSQIFGFGSKL